MPFLHFAGTIHGRVQDCVLPGVKVVAALCALIILLADGTLVYFSNEEVKAPLQFAILAASVLILADYGLQIYRGARNQGKLDRFKEENERLGAQLNQVLVERKDAERQVKELRQALEHEKVLAARETVHSPPGNGALTLLSLLQTKGRFVDFVMEDIAVHDDLRVAAAARFVHQGCRSVLQDHAKITPLESGSEGEELTVEQSYDPSRIKVVGNVKQMPCRGVLLHRGWKAEYLRLPQIIQHGRTTGELIISPAEVEVK